MKEWEEWNCIDVTGAFPRLRSLSIEQCPKLSFIASLESLLIHYSPKMNIPMNSCFDFLVEVEIKNSCDSLTTFPLDFFPKLSRLALRGCNLLRMISQGHPHNHLKHLTIDHCPQFESFPEGGLSATRLERFRIGWLTNLKSLPKDMHVLLPSLTRLEISYCSKVEFSGGGLPSNLEEMHLSFCNKFLNSMKGVLGANNSVKTLWIHGMHVKSFPDEGLLPLSLTVLIICDCWPLVKLDYNGLCQPNSLEKLILEDCEILSCLPEEGLPKSISTFEIWNCPLLKSRLKKAQESIELNLRPERHYELSLSLCTASYESMILKQSGAMVVQEFQIHLNFGDDSMSISCRYKIPFTAGAIVSTRMAITRFLPLSRHAKKTSMVAKSTFKQDNICNMNCNISRPLTAS
ncbi:putative disease resistance protein, partial [Mucuna pruriens]